MIYAPATMERREPDGAKWSIGALVLVLHALLFVALLRTQWPLPTQPLAAAMTVIELRLLSKPDRLVGAGANRHSAKSVSALAAAASPALAKRKPEPRKIQRSVLSDSAVNPPGVADADASASNPANRSGDAGGLTSGAGATGGGGATVRAKFRPPQVVRRYKPSYPEDALFAKHEGSVDIIVTIGTDASIRDARVYRSSGDASLDRASVDAAEHYVFRPARRGDDPTEAQAIVTIDWNIVQSVSHWSRTYEGLNAVGH